MIAAVAAVADKIAGAGVRAFCLLASTRTRCSSRSASFFLLRAFADSIDFAMELSPASSTPRRPRVDRVRRRGAPHPGEAQGRPHAHRRGAEGGVHREAVSINDDAKFSTLNPYTHIYGKYDQAEDLQPLYKRDEGLSHLFHNLARIKLIQLILESKEQMGALLDPPPR